MAITGPLTQKTLVSAVSAEKTRRSCKFPLFPFQIIWSQVFMSFAPRLLLS